MEVKIYIQGKYINGTLTIENNLTKEELETLIDGLLKGHVHQVKFQGVNGDVIYLRHEAVSNSLIIIKYNT